MAVNQRAQDILKIMMGSGVMPGGQGPTPLPPSNVGFPWPSGSGYEGFQKQLLDHLIRLAQQRQRNQVPMFGPGSKSGPIILQKP